MSLFFVYALLLAAVPLYSAPFRFILPGKSETAQDLDAANRVEQEPVDGKSEALKAAISTVIDCTGAAIACSYSPTGVALPSTTISMDSASGLPQRIAFFLADPSDFITAMESVAMRDGNLLLSIRNLVSKVAQDPFLTASYITMERKDYKPMDYIISGSMIFIYPEQLTAKDLVGNIMEMKPSKEPAVALIDLRILGNRLENPVSLAGEDNITINQKHNLEITPTGDFMINGETTSWDSFTMGTGEPE